MNFEPSKWVFPRRSSWVDDRPFGCLNELRKRLVRNGRGIIRVSRIIVDSSTIGVRLKSPKNMQGFLIDSKDLVRALIDRCVYWHSNI